MDASRENASSAVKNTTTVEKKSERELVATRTINGPAHLVFEAWTKAELFRQWWVPQSLGMTLLSCELDVRVGGKYRLVFRHPQAPEPLAFFGTYLEVVPCSRLSWSNDEAGENGHVTSVTFEEKAGKTRVIVHELYPSKAALEAEGGALDGMPETFDQLEAFVAGMVKARAGE